MINCFNFTLLFRECNDSVVLTVYRNLKKAHDQARILDNHNLNHIITSQKLVCQGDQASMGIINSTENDYLMLSNSVDSNKIKLTENMLFNQDNFTISQIESFKTEDFVYCAGNADVEQNSYPRMKKPIKVDKIKDIESFKTQDNDELPSPIPFLPPLTKKQRSKRTKINNLKNQLVGTVNINESKNYNIITIDQKKSTLTDSDYKTQSNSTIDCCSSSNDYRQTNQIKYFSNDFELEIEVSIDEIIENLKKH